jgi:MFS transporter, PAT family, beta-lactamase induction signal transducer AmpG
MPNAAPTPPPAAPPARGPWWWVPSLYFAQAMPFVFVNIVSTYAYTRMGVSAVLIGLTSWLALPWTFKPLWSPLVEIVSTERRWVWTTEFLAAAAFAIVAFGYATDHFFLWTLVGYGLLAVASATHDIAADGYYMRVLTPHNQTWFTGIRNVAFRGGWIYGEGLLVMLAGVLIRLEYDPATAWGLTHGAAAATFFLLAIYHAALLPAAPPKPAYQDASVSVVFREVGRTFAKFFVAIPLATALPFLLLYRFAEAQLTKFAGVFLLDGRDAGGLGLLEDQVGLINGTLGIGALLAGGVLGGVLAARHGTRAWLLPMAVMMNVPNLVYLALAYYQPENLNYVAAGVVTEKFGYGFGFTGYMLYMLYLARGEHQTSFYAICTGFMSLGLILPGSLAGYPLQWLGYTGFFVWIMVATIPSFLVALIVYFQMDPNFGRPEDAA